MADKEIKEGDEVSWPWSGGRPGGTAAEVATEGKVSVDTHRGNTVSKNAEPDNPAVHVERPGNDVVKKASELEVDEEGPKHDGGDEKAGEEKGKAKTGGKRAAKHKPEGGNGAKKQKTKDVNGDEEAKEKKGKGAGRGRPKKGSAESNGAASKPKAEKKEKPKKEPKKAATADGQPRRSARNKS